MDMKSAGLVFAGVTVAYAGVLSLGEDLSVGVGMVIIGGALLVLPLWRALSLRKTTSGRGTSPVRGKRKAHLRVVNNEHEERPTIH